MSKCPICETVLAEEPRDLEKVEGAIFRCPQCGDYVWRISQQEALSNRLRDEPGRRMRLSHRMCWMPRGGEPPQLEWDLIERLAGMSLPDLPEQADKLESVGSA